MADQKCVREILGQVERVHSWDHDVVGAVHHENGLLYLTEAREAIAVRCGPCLNRSQLGTGDLIAAGRLAVLVSRSKSFQEGPACCLAGVSGSEEELEHGFAEGLVIFHPCKYGLYF